MKRWILAGSLLLLAGCRSSRTAPPANSITLHDESGAAQSNRPFTISRVFAKGEIAHCPQARVAATDLLTQCDVKTRWPDGSVQHALVSFHANLPSSGSLTVDFHDQPMPAAQGQSQGQSQGMTQAEMLAFSPWNAHMTLTHGGTPQYGDARAMLEAGLWRYWLQGPICTQVIVEERAEGLHWDLGWDASKPLHPIFVLTFYPGFAGVKEEMILENMWTTKLEDQTYDLTLRTGMNYQPVYTKTGFTHIAQSRWRKVFWDGGAPGAVKIDYHLAYMIHSQAVPNWDLSKVVPMNAVERDVSDFQASDKGDLGGHALWYQYMPNTGGRYDIGVFPVWYVHYLYTMDPRLFDVVLGLAEAGSHAPMYWRESDPNRYYDSGHTVKAFGYPLSLDARPNLSFVTGMSAGPDGLHPVGPTSEGGWSVDLAHQPAFAYVPYLITGDWYFLEELGMAAAGDLMVGHEGCSFYSRCYALGWMPYAIQTRGVAWGLRDLGEAAFTAPDGSAEKKYLVEKLNNNIEVEEGFQDITNGSFQPSDPSCTGYDPYAPHASKWCYGRMIVGEGKSNPLHFMDHGNPYAGGCTNHVNMVVDTDPYACSYWNAPYQLGYKFGVLGHLEELGFPVGPWNHTALKFLLHQILDPGGNPWLAAAYQVPFYRLTTNDYYKTWQEYMLAFSTDSDCGDGTLVNWRTINHWSTCNGGQGSDADTGNPSYPHIVRSASSYLAGLDINEGNLKGADARKWMDDHVDYEDQVGENPQWELLPRGETSTPPGGGGTPPGGGGTPPAPLPYAPSGVQDRTTYVTWQMEQTGGNEIACQMQTPRFPASVHIFCKQYQAFILEQDVSLAPNDAKGVVVILQKHAKETSLYRDNLMTLKLAQPVMNEVTWEAKVNASEGMGMITCGENGVGCRRGGGKK